MNNAVRRRRARDVAKTIRMGMVTPRQRTLRELRLNVAFREAQAALHKAAAARKAAEA